MDLPRSSFDSLAFAADVGPNGRGCKQESRSRRRVGVRQERSTAEVESVSAFLQLLHSAEDGK